MRMRDFEAPRFSLFSPPLPNDFVPRFCPASRIVSPIFGRGSVSETRSFPFPLRLDTTVQCSNRTPGGGRAWYGAVRNGTGERGVVWCGTVLLATLSYATLRCSTARRGGVAWQARASHLYTCETFPLLSTWPGVRLFVVTKCTVTVRRVERAFRAVVMRLWAIAAARD